MNKNKERDKITSAIFKKVNSEESLYEYMKELHEKHNVIFDKELLSDMDILEKLFREEKLVDSMVAPLFGLTKEQIKYRRTKIGVKKSGIESLDMRGLVNKVTKEMKETYGENWEEILDKGMKEMEEKKAYFKKLEKFDDKISDIIAGKNNYPLNKCLMDAKINKVEIGERWLKSKDFFETLFLKEKAEIGLIAFLLNLSEDELLYKMEEAGVKGSVENRLFYYLSDTVEREELFKIAKRYEDKKR